MQLVELSVGQYQLVYNMFSLAIAAMLASFVFFVLVRQQLTPSYRPAMIMSALVVVIAGYHYLRIFNNWGEAFHLDGSTYKPTGMPFNDAYRYVDWLLTVPLLCAELVAVLNLKAGVRGPLMAKLIAAAALMIATGYPGEVATDLTTRTIWGLISTVPFIYILYALWVELSKAASGESAEVKVLLRNARLLILGTWGFYPIVYLLPELGVPASGSLLAVQVGYSISDIAAKCGYGFLIYAIARAKMDAKGETVELAAARAA
jgi:bacteriorhodopsin